MSGDVFVALTWGGVLLASASHTPMHKTARQKTQPPPGPTLGLPQPLHRPRQTSQYCHGLFAGCFPPKSPLGTVQVSAAGFRCQFWGREGEEYRRERPGRAGLRGLC